MFLNSLGLIGTYCTDRGWPVMIQFMLDQEAVEVVREDEASPQSVVVRIFADPDIQELECKRAFAPWVEIPRDQWEDAATYCE